MTNCKRYKVAAIDLGTVSSRLVLAQVEGGAIVESSKHTEITDLGEGVDATGRFCEAAVERVLAACRMFVDEARTFGAACICTTCTSAARDASNAALLLDGLHELGLEPQVIPGEVEARLTFFGVAHDFAGERIIVADSGGGSTELATGVYAPERGVFALEGTRSLDIGCRRVTERFFPTMPPARGELLACPRGSGSKLAACGWHRREKPLRHAAGLLPLPRGQASSSPPILWACLSTLSAPSASSRWAVPLPRSWRWSTNWSRTTRTLCTCASFRWSRFRPLSSACLRWMLQALPRCRACSPSART